MPIAVMYNFDPDYHNYLQFWEIVGLVTALGWFVAYVMGKTGQSPSHSTRAKKAQTWILASGIGCVTGVALWILLAATLSWGEFAVGEDFGFGLRWIAEILLFSTGCTGWTLAALSIIGHGNKRKPTNKAG